MAITAALVKELRERTGSGMMECKKALVETNGDIDQAIENMRKAGMAKADKKANRTAADGVVVAGNTGTGVVLLEVNCETDFVAKGDDFGGFVDAVLAALSENRVDSVEALNDAAIAGGTVDEVRRALIAKIGENIAIRRFEYVDGETVGVYSHGGRIIAAAALNGGEVELARDIAMHITASTPLYITQNDIDQDYIAKEKDILTEQAASSGKPAEIIEKMIQGRLNKQLNEVTLYGQPFVKDPDQSIEKLVKAAGVDVTAMSRYAVGEGIEVEETDYLAEVAAAAQV